MPSHHLSSACDPACAPRNVTSASRADHHGHVSIVYTQCFTIASVVVVIVVVVVVVEDASQAVQH